MRANSSFSALITSVLCCLGTASLADVAGVKGQTFDRLTFEAPSGKEMRITARGMAVMRHADSAATITVIDNGAQRLGPETVSQERWTRTISITGAGAHDVLLLCQGVKASPVYCGLTLEDEQARPAE
ncbi:hypothetical protein ACFOWB_02530 [Chenggangzhangella methanolivorans]|uniref:hypothetical protein n=1 Tax=Chenggangzhangella methanolivorans TaxID=1437009 RepID=UPI00361455B8